MAANTFVLDSSALMAFIEKEPGAERVRQIIRKENILIPWLSILEVVYISHRELGETEARTRYAMLKQLKAHIIWEANESILLTASRLKATHRLYLADAIIAAIAIQHSATLVHKDPEFDALQGKLSLESLPYKPLNS